MNYLAHALPFLDRPYFAAATGVPDWLTVVDRAVRLRRKSVEPFVDDPYSLVADVAGGVLQHLNDDARFHATRAFAELQLALSRLVRDTLEAPSADSSFRPSFLGHLLVEVLLDASLAAEDEHRLHAYYAVLDRVDAGAIEAAVNRMAARPTQRLAWMIDEFRRHRILFDYLDDARLLVRLNQVMRRVGLETLPHAFIAALSPAREMVAARQVELASPWEERPLSDRRCQS